MGIINHKTNNRLIEALWSHLRNDRFYGSNIKYIGISKDNNSDKKTLHIDIVASLDNPQDKRGLGRILSTAGENIEKEGILPVEESISFHQYSSKQELKQYQQKKQ